MNWQKSDLHTFTDARKQTRLFVSRVIFAMFIVFILMGVIIGRFYTLQIKQFDDFITQSDENRIQVRPVAPNRGLIFDAHNSILALNAPSFTLSIIPERVKDKDALIAQLQQYIELKPHHIERFKRNLKLPRKPYQPAPLKLHLSEEEIAILAVNEYRFTGVEVEAALKREYPDGEYFVHALGYVGRINLRELNGFTKEQVVQYGGTNSIGKTGLERSYEAKLLGEPGSEHIETNARGRVLKVLTRVAPEPGKDLRLFLDGHLQRVAQDALKGRRGAVVAIDVETGGVQAIVSNPSYDPNLFVTGISYKNYNALRDSWEKPLFNRTIQAQYPAGSTLKPMLGLVGLSEGIVTKKTTVYDPGFFQVPGDKRLYREWKKGGHGSGVNLRKAIVESCDIYFYDLAYKAGAKKMHDVGEFFGLGLKTGLDIPSERSGIWPSPAWKKQRKGRPWFTGDSINMSIGQGYVLVTPLQLAVMTATMANKGELIQPRLVSHIGETPTVKKILNTIELPDKYWEHVHDAMQGVLHDAYSGTAWSVGRKAKYRIAGKTGTAQVVGIAQDGEYESEKLSERNRDHALFVGFAPADNPKIAVAVILENGESSSKAAAVAKTVMDARLLPSASAPIDAAANTTDTSSITANHAPEQISPQPHRRAHL